MQDMALRQWVNRRLLIRFTSATLFSLVLVFLLSPIKRTTTSRKSYDDAILPAPRASLDALRVLPSTSPIPITNATGRGELPDKTQLSQSAAKATSSSGAVDSVPITQAVPPNKPQFHVVIAHHSEEPYWIRAWIENLRSISYVQELGIKIIIYTKSPDNDLTAIKDVSGADEAIRLPNVGREGGTYLHHILSVYDDPPKFIMFTQSYIKKGQKEKGKDTATLKPWLFDRLKTKFGSDTGFMSLDRKHDICHCGHCTDMGRDDFYPLWPQLYTMLQGTVCQQLEGHVLSFNGHFIVSRKRVVTRSRGVYEYLKELVDAPEDHWIHAEPEPKWFEVEKGKSVPSNPKFGHTLERLWHVVFNCSDPADMTDCDLKGMKAEGLGGCTCKDFPSTNLQQVPG